MGVASEVWMPEAYVGVWSYISVNMFPTLYKTPLRKKHGKKISSGNKFP